MNNVVNNETNRRSFLRNYKLKDIEPKLVNINQISKTNIEKIINVVSFHSYTWTILE